jgi:hypothetical protein
VMTDIINKLGVHERFDIAWKHVNYGAWGFPQKGALRLRAEKDGGRVGPHAEASAACELDGGSWCWAGRE